uniref:Cytochrome P450 82D169 n=1 Tax=Tripterygium wilfordii TaxID=458696 RepID=A0A8T8L8H7_TRIWF|nr:cytochrome P450 82D169 [Tripterygium wilfordii]
MEYSITTIGAATLVFVVLMYCLSSSSRKASEKRQPPQAGGALPFIGHLHLLVGSKPAHVALGDMADKYGPIFTFKLGVHRAIIVGNFEVAKECFTTNDKVFADRPIILASEVMCYDLAMFGFSSYGPYWRHIRKIATVELLSNHRLEMLKHVRESEVNASIKEIYEISENKNPIEMKRWLGDLNLNLICRMISGTSYAGGARRTKDEKEDKKRCEEAVRAFIELAGTFAMADALPYLRRFDLGGTEKAMKRTAEDLDQILQGWLDEHKMKKKMGISGEDFMDVMLSICDDEAAELHSYDSDTIIKATCLNLVLAGADTTTVALTWALCLLLNNLDVLKKAQEELDTHVGRGRQVQESDIENLVYLQAILKETLRIYPPTPLNALHISSKDCSVSGYHVPKGTRLFVNIGKIHRDSNVWADPDEFRPERFLTTHKDFDVRGQHHELVPFGAGRRMCPGISFALQVMLFTFAKLLHGFEIASADGEPIDMTGSPGLTNLKATPLELMLSPRLPTHLYN